MINPNDLFKKRLKGHYKETGRYLRYMLNDHLTIALFFILAALAYFYQQWLETLTPEFPADWVIAVILGFLVTRSPIRTLLKEADAVFLLPAEEKLKGYFSRTFIYSFIFQLYLLIAGLGAITPLYLKIFTDKQASSLLYLGVLLIVLKVWNLLSVWWLLKERDSKNRMIDVVVRFGFNVFILFFFLQEDAFLYASITSVIFVMLLLFNYSQYGKKGLAWDLLIEKEQASMQAFYRIANLFTDVPHLKKKAKKRHFLVNLFTAGVPFKHQQTYSYLYRITFVRSSDYFGLYVRLLIIAAFLIFWVPNVWFKLVFALLFIYLSGIQIMTMWNHHLTIQWIDIYPVTRGERKKSLLQILLWLLLIKTFILGICMLIVTSIQEMLILWCVGGIFSYVFVQMYMKQRLDKRLT